MNLIKNGLIISFISVAVNQAFYDPSGVKKFKSGKNGNLSDLVIIYDENRTLFIHDVKPDSVLEPGEHILPGGVIYPKLRVRNIGDYPESFPVTFRIESVSGIQYNETVYIDSLAPRDTTTITFSQPWFVPNLENCTFNVTAFTSLRRDRNPTNDTIHTISITYWWIIVDSIPAPLGEFRMGLTDDGDYLWNFTNATNSYPVFYKLRKSDGSIVHQFNFPGGGIHYCLGLTMINGQLYTSEFYPNQGRIWVIDTLGNLIRNFSVNYDIRGLTWDGQYLWAAEVDSQRLVKMDTFGNINTIYQGDGNIQWFMDITYDQRDEIIWANDYGTGAIKKLLVAPSSFNVIMSRDHPAPPDDHPEGITYCEESGIGYLYTGAAYSQYIWKIKVHGLSITEDKKVPIPIPQFILTVPSILHSRFIIDYQIKEVQTVEIKIYGGDGRIVHKLWLGSVSPGRHQIIWDGKDIRGKKIQTGIYFVHFNIGKYNYIKKVIFLN
ncbi:MAG: FlgD immunoglobulin-like domain containing protein [candidate division WOR-3 bacterium]